MPGVTRGISAGGQAWIIVWLIITGCLAVASFVPFVGCLTLPLAILTGLTSLFGLAMSETRGVCPRCGRLRWRR
jgi:hypothetical protein